MKSLSLATKNPHKVQEIQDILLGLPLRLCPLPPDLPEAPEDHEDMESNARQKASTYAQQTRTWCLADDSGLEVDALGGRPGVHSARYAGPEATSADNRCKLLEALAEVGLSERRARFRCVVALANPAGEVVATSEGSLEGRILEEERGEGGFGYDPLFLPNEGRRSLAELSSADKNALSHRGRALEGLRSRLRELC